MLKGRTVAIGVCGGIAAYKVCEVVSSLKKLGADIHVVMTSNAQEFVSPLTFETLSGNRVIADMFDRNFEYKVGHVSLAKKADIFLVAPATANIIAKAAQGIADDFLSTTLLATKSKVIFAPAMNTGMLTNPAYIENVNILKSRGALFIASQSGLLACGDTGDGRLAEPSLIVEFICRELAAKQDFAGKTLLITAGATVEDIDRVRFISNYSSGKMGLSIAYAARDRGAKVILIYGKISGECQDRLIKDNKNIELVSVKSTVDMFDAVKRSMESADIIVKAAAPADYRIKKQASNKLKSEELVLELVKNPDIAKMAGENKGNRKLVIFCAETENLIENAKKKLKSKNADLVVANDVTQEGAGFEVDTNIVTFVTASGAAALPLMSKSMVAEAILDKILSL